MFREGTNHGGGEHKKERPPSPLEVRTSLYQTHTENLFFNCHILSSNY